MKYKFCIIFLLSFHIIFSQVPSQIFEESKMILTEKIYFDFGLYDIRTDADSILQTVLSFCQGKTNLQLNITAHTDAIGNNESNQTLSQNRANAVKNYLLTQGLQIDSIQTAVFGEEIPIAENNTDEGRQKNRRATIEVLSFQKQILISGEVLDEETNQAIDAEIIIRTKDTADSTRTDSLGRFSSKVPLGAVTGVDIYAKGYFFETQMMKALPGKLKPLNIKLSPVRAGEKVDLKNLYFYGNKAILLPRSKPELAKVLKFMEINYCAKIEIAGHVNLPNRPAVRKDSWEYQLSVRRAKTLYDYLLTNGISEKRITFAGYGNWEMRYPKARNEREQELNRRVEIRILETGIKSAEEPLDNSK